jgi:RNA polymerase sigma-70 factor (ECF subfamily)
MAEAGGAHALAFREHRRKLWDVCYRMTGVAADADDILQETFARAISECPDLSRPLGPWLMRVAIHLARDLLRARKRRKYIGPWLPGPIEIEGGEREHIAEDTPQTRYDLRESASFAFLLALEALTPMQRAVLLLRDVFDHSVRETADAVGSSKGAVKTAHHRARRAVETYQRTGSRPTPAAEEQHRRALEQFIVAMMSGDVELLRKLLAKDVTLTSDAGGAYITARKPVRGRERTIAFLFGVSKKSPPPLAWETRMLNGLPALYVELPRGSRYAPRYVLRHELNAADRIAAIHLVLEPRKLAALRSTSRA